MPPSSNSTYFKRSIFDYDWIDEIEIDMDKGALLIAAGLFNYFPEEQLKEFCDKVADRFLGGSLVFDVPSALLKKIVNKKYEKMDIKEIDHMFGLGNPKRVLKWTDKIEPMSCIIFFRGVELDKRWTRRPRFLMRLFRSLKFYKLIKLEFKK